MPTLQFKGKTFVQNHHLVVQYHQLVPKKELSLTDKVSLHDNLIIQGDNLIALKALLPNYAGRIKCIYIDPPYNTGNENWVYNDNVNSPMIKEWLKSVVDKEDMTRHDKWLCMMMPRLKLLHELLSEDGAIFISCDDNEQHNLRCLLDEVFGEQNFIQNIIWQKKYTQSNDAKYFSDTHDFIICYAKNKIEGEVKQGFVLNLLSRTDEQNDRYTNPDDDPNGAWMSQPLHAKSGTDKTYIFKFKNGVEWTPPSGTFPRYSIDTLKKADQENKIWFGSKGDAVPRMKKYLPEMKDGVTPKSIWAYDEVGSNDDAKKPIKELFGKNLFDSPKPVELLKRIIELSTNRNDIILDSFAGSGTTAHAVLELNKEDSGNRQFILVEQEDYANSITAERVRRVIKGVPSAKNEILKQGTGGTFSYFELGQAIELESLLRGNNLPSYTEFARYLFYTATGEEFSEKAVNESTGFIGESTTYEVYLIYKPDVEWLKQNALTLQGCQSLPPFKGKQRLVFAPCKYVDDDTCRIFRIDFCQLPYAIYRIQK
ncbi:MAG: site-specific DNA-methyltransferase [Tannerella sp.]|jgi:adenine-specific DNA-methyltransferase|nr:site-specific DNA-methyltransferase [Tannerella sp.]